MSHAEDEINWMRCESAGLDSIDRQWQKKAPRPQNDYTSTSIGVKWQTTGGDTLLITDMTESHLTNTFNAVARRIGTQQQRFIDADTFAVLQAEKNRRGIK